VSSELLAILAGLASAIGYGAGDFGGGYASRRTDALLVVLVSNSTGLVLILLIAFFLAEPLPPAADLLAAAAAGTLGTIGLVRFYQELAGGKMGVIAPSVAVVTVSIPVLFSAISEGMPKTSQIAGILLAIMAIWLITREGTTRDRDEKSALTLRDMAVILVIGLMFSAFLVTIGTVSERSIAWPLVAARGVSILFVILFLALSGRWGSSVPRSQLKLLGGIGFLDVGGSVMFALSSALGRLDIAAVVTSLYPAVTVLLARIMLSEELGSRQWLGIGLALLAIVLITID
jgi:drug/metabolite transporter (DMT)-like permease